MEMLLTTENNHAEDGCMGFEDFAEASIKFQSFTPICSTPLAHRPHTNGYCGL